MCFKIVRFVGIRRGRELRLWGRPDELARLWSQFEQITAGRLHVTLVVGNPGIGKAYRSRKSQGALTRSKLMSIEQPKEVGFGHHHAVVIGAGMAGLVTSRILSGHFDSVTVVERDRLPEETGARRGIPQGQHLHVLLNKGASLLRELFPDLPAALAERGAPYVDGIADVRWYHFGVWKTRFPSPIQGYSQSRPFLEQCVRRCLSTKANVRFLDHCEVTVLGA